MIYNKVSNLNKRKHFKNKINQNISKYIKDLLCNQSINYSKNVSFIIPCVK